MNIIHRITNENDVTTVTMETVCDHESVYLNINSEIKTNEMWVSFNSEELNEYIEHLERCKRFIQNQKLSVKKED